MAANSSRMNICIAALILAAATVCAPDGNANLLVNGDFETGSVTPWTAFDLNGNAGESFGLPDVTAFDVTGSGSSQAARLQVGTSTLGTPGGGGLAQMVSTSAGLLTLSVDFAAMGPANADAGTFSLVVDGTVLQSDALGAITDGETLRGSLSGSLLVAAGQHAVEIEVTRSFVNSSGFGFTPFQFFDNAVAAIETSPIPEPGTLSLLVAGLIGFAAIRRRSRSVLTR